MNLPQILSSILRARIPIGHPHTRAPRRETDPKPPGVPRRACQHARAIRRRLSYAGQILASSH